MKCASVCTIIEPSDESINWMRKIVCRVNEKTVFFFFIFSLRVSVYIAIVLMTSVWISLFFFHLLSIESGFFIILFWFWRTHKDENELPENWSVFCFFLCVWSNSKFCWIYVMNNFICLNSSILLRSFDKYSPPFADILMILLRIVFFFISLSRSTPLIDVQAMLHLHAHIRISQYLEISDGERER